MGRRGGLDSLSLDRAGKFGAKSEEMDGTPNFKLLIAILLYQEQLYYSYQEG